MLQKKLSRALKMEQESSLHTQNLHRVINLMHVSHSAHELPRSCSNEVQDQPIVPTFTKASNKALCVSLGSIKTDFTLLF